MTHKDRAYGHGKRLRCRGSFLAPMRTGASGVNSLAVHPTHGMLAVGTQDGIVQCWDPRQRLPLGSCSPFEHPRLAAPPIADDEPSSQTSPREITALRFDSRGLQLAVGTSTGHVALYDIRRGAPLLVKDHQYGLPIVDIKYHSSGKIVSADAKAIKLWEPEGGKTYTFSSVFLCSSSRVVI